MRELELTKEHKEKLIEMIEKLFPEYNFSISEPYCDVCTENIIFLWDKDKSFRDCWNKWIKIHWYEFCLTQLVKRIYEKYSDFEQKKLRRLWFNSLKGGGSSHSFLLLRDHNQLIGKMLDSNEHYVDYLYKEFKILKI